MGWTSPESLASLATALGTLVLAVATFASVRSANRAARTAERSMLIALRPLLVPSKMTDEAQKIMFGDGKWVKIPGGCGWAEFDNGNVYLVASLRNVGPGMAVLHGWRFAAEHQLGTDVPDPAQFRRNVRDIYIAPGETGFWQGAFRDPDDPRYTEAVEVVKARSALTIEVLYGDHEGGQRVVTRFGFQPRTNDESWLLSAGRHWNLDRQNPRTDADHWPRPSEQGG